MFPARLPTSYQQPPNRANKNHTKDKNLHPVVRQAYEYKQKETRIAALAYRRGGGLLSPLPWW